ncbi:uncharacterized protein LOC113565168 [Drosophila persimilis]|uniref:uncharacterized protein LOC113565168 n=1 Tax=Drosophila persimilis TaxID=7234 RepID=UPI000F081EBE|nr:uncharacterized protein LOC113565168 [Drosophila persimilis]
MMTSSDDSDLLMEEEGQPLTIWQKILFFMVGLTSALTICVLIRLSNKLTTDAEHKAMMHFKDISAGHIGHRHGY